ncbi:MAG: hypothetical protein M3O90_11070 [Actinomycetota bacterium]|nr:hypothetical protein [Actinomycetota bacterium]
MQMLETTSFKDRPPGHRHMVVLLAFLVLTFLAAMAAEAGATLRIANHNDPAGDPTVITYRMESPTWALSPYDFKLPDADYLSFMLPTGTYTASALLPPGWQVGDIQCVGPRPQDFHIDVANGRVTVTHGANEEHICAFTNRKVSASGGPGAGRAPAPGVAPSPAANEIPKVVLPRKPALLGVTPGRGFVNATIRITRRSVIKARLLWRGARVVGITRVVRKAGTHVVKVSLYRKTRRQLRRRGLKRVTLTLRIVVVERNGATLVFRHGVVVSL